MTLPSPLSVPQEQRDRLHGAASVDRDALLPAVLHPGGHGRQLHHQVHDALHRGGLLQPHLLHLHLRRHQEDGGLLQVLPHQHRLQARLRDRLQVRVPGPRPE